MSECEQVKTKKQLSEDYLELNAQLELIEGIIRRVESNLKNGSDLIYLTAESVLKIMYNDFLTMKCKILNSKNKIQLELYELISERKPENNNG